MKIKWLFVFAAILGCVYMWDSSRKSIAESVIDDVYLNLGNLPDGNNKALLTRADKQIRMAHVMTVVFGKRKIGKAADMISGQKTSLESYMRDLKNIPDDDGIKISGVKSVAQTLRDIYASGITDFKRDLEYIRRGL